MPTQEQMARWVNPDGSHNRHASCHHRIYRLNCEQFEALLDRAKGACQICGREDAHLQIDHDHDRSTDRPVRGLVCAKCNALMRRVDDGSVQPTEAVRDYLAGAIPGPPMPNHTQARTFRVSDEVWDSAVALAAERGESVSDVIRRALARYARRSK